MAGNSVVPCHIKHAFSVHQYRAYPSVLHYELMRQVTNFAEPTGILGQGPFNRFSHGKLFRPRILTKSYGRMSIRVIPLRVSILARSRLFSRRQPLTVNSCCRC